MGKRRGPDIFDDNPPTEDFLEWMVSPDGQTAGEVSGLVFATLENASVDAKRRKIIWAAGERLSIEQSAERIRAEHPDRPRELIEISLCSWFEHRLPESGSERQINELDRLFGPWIRDRERKSRAAKKMTEKSALSSQCDCFSAAADMLGPRWEVRTTSALSVGECVQHRGVICL